jgi:hypothetical protein
MTDMIKITAVEPLDGYWLRLTFSDGAIKDVDVSEIVARGGVFSEIRDRRDVFDQVRVNPDSRTIEWPGEIDLDPEVLYGRYEPASDVRLARREVREPTAAPA